jgi:uncharacterized SAM-binding protein YcdF (DUF218 family)
MIGFFGLIAFFFFVPTIMMTTKSPSSNNDNNTSRLRFSNPRDIPKDIVESLDAIIVLGGGVPESIDHPPVYVEKRCDDAIDIFHMRQNQVPILCLSAGTAHLPQLLGSDGLPVWESTASASYLLNKGIPSHFVYVETTSYDTIGNAYYTRTTHTDINGWRKLLIITNEFHMDRTIAIFDWIFLSCSGITNEGPPKKRKGNKSNNQSSNQYELFYLDSPNVGLSSEAVHARKEREAASARTVREKLAPTRTTLKDVYQFLTQDHALYTAQKLVERGRGSAGGDVQASSTVKESYGAGPAGGL